MLPEQTCHLLVQLADPLLDQLQLFERHLHQPAVDRVELRARTPCIAPLRRRRASAGRPRRPNQPDQFPLCQRLQHPPCTCAEQIRNQTGQLDMGFFQQCL